LRLLLDTHILLWWQRRDRQLGRSDTRAIANADAVYVSAASLWEIAIEVRLGKLEASLDSVFNLEADGFRELPIRGLHARAAGNLPDHHRDPFDRVIAAQSQIEGLTLVTSDPIFARYAVKTLS
jgi:PIN domain nuclease of toxin-antitoxin system